MSLIHYQPWPMSRLARNGRLGRLAAGHEENLETGWAPAVDIAETDNGFVLTADLPGVAADQIDITMEDGVLVISGQRSTHSEETRDNVYRSERLCGKFSRSFTLPDSADAQQIRATSEHGVLTISIPKKAEMAPRRISVNVA